MLALCSKLKTGEQDKGAGPGNAFNCPGGKLRLALSVTLAAPRETRHPGILKNPQGLKSSSPGGAAITGGRGTPWIVSAPRSDSFAVSIKRGLSEDRKDEDDGQGLKISSPGGARNDAFAVSIKWGLSKDPRGL